MAKLAGVLTALVTLFVRTKDIEANVSVLFVFFGGGGVQPVLITDILL